MASQKQIEANRRNAEKSTGPKSAEGKATVARNALKHGLAGHGVILPGEMAGQLQDRVVFLRPSYRPDGPAQEWIFQRLCIETVRADLCLHQTIALRDEAASRASESWDDDRALDAEELGSKIAARPELIQPTLLRSKHGARWLEAHWEELERQLDLTGSWTDAASTRAMHLLGLQGDGRDGVWAALTGGTPDGARALIREQVAALRARLDGFLDDRDDRACADAMAGLAADGPDVRRVLRYESAALHRFQGWTRELRRLQHPAPPRSDRTARGPAPEASTAPAARPASSGPLRDPNRPDRRAIAAAPRPTADSTAADAPRSAAPSTSKAADARETPASPVRTSPCGPAPARPANRHERRAQAARERRDRRS